MRGRDQALVNLVLRRVFQSHCVLVRQEQRFHSIGFSKLSPKSPANEPGLAEEDATLLTASRARECGRERELGVPSGPSRADLGPHLRAPLAGRAAQHGRRLRVSEGAVWQRPPVGEAFEAQVGESDRRERVPTMAMRSGLQELWSQSPRFA